MRGAVSLLLSRSREDFERLRDFYDVHLRSLVKLGSIIIKKRVLNSVILVSKYKPILRWFLAVLILGVGAWGLYAFYSKPKFESIVFSDERYPEFQRQISTLMNEQTHSLSGRTVDETSLSYTSASEVEVALVDLNDDHTPEILALVGARYYSNSVGGLGFVIYSQAKGSLHPITDNVMTTRSVVKSSHKTNGYYDLAWFADTSLFLEQHRKYFLTFSKKGYYIYGKSEKITDKERKLFPYENL